MRVVEIMNGVGNQLFAYAFYKKIEKVCGECYADLGWFDCKERETWYPYQLDLLGLKVKEIKRDKYCVKEYYMQNNHISAEEFDILSQNMSIPILNLKREKNAYSCDNLWEYDNVYYRGYYQNISNFLDVLEDIKTEVTFPDNEDVRFQKIKERIKGDHSVSVHVRLNDYSDREDFEDVCPRVYYEKAIQRMLEIDSKSNFYIFSNKMEDVKKFLPSIGDYTFVDVNSRFHGIGDLELMTLCKHNIIPNSTFGWWGAVLNKNADKIVIAPDEFNIRVENVKKEDINLWLSDWIRIAV